MLVRPSTNPHATMSSSQFMYKCVSGPPGLARTVPSSIQLVDKMPARSSSYPIGETKSGNDTGQESSQTIPHSPHGPSTCLQSLMSLGISIPRLSPAQDSWHAADQNTSPVVLPSKDQKRYGGVTELSRIAIAEWHHHSQVPGPPTLQPAPLSCSNGFGGTAQRMPESGQRRMSLDTARASVPARTSAMGTFDGRGLQLGPSTSNRVLGHSTSWSPSRYMHRSVPSAPGSGTAYFTGPGSLTAHPQSPQNPVFRLGTALPSPPPPQIPRPSSLTDLRSLSAASSKPQRKLPSGWQVPRLPSPEEAFQTTLQEVYKHPEHVIQNHHVQVKVIESSQSSLF
jgi:hypothetical protein